MLALYEASQLAMHGEQIIDDALSFAKRNLETLVTKPISPRLAKLIANFLHRPLYKCIPRLATRQFISFYEEEEESKNEIVLKFAKTDFNRLQLLYQEELCEITRWCRNLGICSNLVYTRDRIVEAYFLWGHGIYFEPQFSKARVIIFKFVEILAVLDDTYDAYGTIEELRIFTDAVQRMELTAVEELPEYMKYIYRILFNILDEWDQELAKDEGFPYDTSYARDALKELVRVFLVEAEWCRKRYVPLVEEYMSIARTTSCHTVFAICSFLSMGELAGIPRAFDWVNALPKMHVASQEICRLINDTVSHEEEQKRGHVASFIECYMKQYGVSEEEAIEASKKRIDDAWKNINEDFMEQSSSTISMAVLMQIVNLARIVDVAYRYDNGYNNPEKHLKVHIEALLIQPIPI